MEITNYINKGIKKYNPKEFFNIINNCWDEGVSDTIKEIILNDIYSNIKPEIIETIEDLGKLLNNNFNGSELDNEYNINVEKICKENNWVVCFPYSDDNLEVRGIIDDELSAWDGGNYLFVKKGGFYPAKNYDNTYHKAFENMVINNGNNIGDLKCIWCDEDYQKDEQRYIWKYEVMNKNLPHVYFDILDEDIEDKTIWARCCIIDLSSIL